jgi:hypothetical protein
LGFGGTYYALDSDFQLLFIFDFNDFMCFSCLDSFLGFYHSLPFPFRDEHSLGVLVYDKRGKEKERSVRERIIEKKLRGFVQANQIEFPVLIDHLDVFKSQVKEGSSVILFDPRDGLLRRYKFPLSLPDREKILEIVGYQ